MNKTYKSLSSLYREVLYREPDKKSFTSYKNALKKTPVDINHIRSLFLNSYEYTEIVKPLKKAVSRAYQQVLFRKPSDGEAFEHINHFRSALIDDGNAVKAIQNNDIIRHLDFRPLNVEMDITTACNIRCKMCFFSYPPIFKRKRHDMDLKTFRKIAEQVFPYTNRLSLSLSTEALLNKDFCEMAAIGIRKNTPKIYISTNATLLKEETIEKMIQMGFHAINVSLDAATKETFEKLRRGARFETVIQNVETLNQLKAKAGSKLPRLCCSFVMMKSNIHEVTDFIRLAHRLNAQDAHLLHMAVYNVCENAEESLSHHKELCNNMLKKARALANKLKIRLIEPGDFLIEKAPKPEEDQKAKTCFDLNLDRYSLKGSFCPFPWRFLGINPFGEVHPCGWWFKGGMGNIHEKPFEQIWNGKRFRDLRKRLLNNIPPENCRSCPSAGMGKVFHPEAFALNRLF